MTRLTDRLTRLATLSAAELREEWLSVYQSEAPRLSADLLRHGLAWRLQEISLGGLTERNCRMLDSPEKVSTQQQTSLRSGTQLVRSWNGRTIAVRVDEEGYVFEERRYRSLSAIAREVTGTHWSGPRFFGLHANG